MEQMKIADKEQLLESLEKHKPSDFILFVNKYFPIKFAKGEYPLGTYSALVGFFVASAGMVIFDQMNNKPVASAFCLLYIPLVVHVLINLVSFKLNQARIEKICKELNLTPEEYNFNIEYYKL
jgi:hypothetical protein